MKLIKKKINKFQKGKEERRRKGRVWEEYWIEYDELASLLDPNSCAQALPRGTGAFHGLAGYFHRLGKKPSDSAVHQTKYSLRRLPNRLVWWIVSPELSYWSDTRLDYSPHHSDLWWTMIRYEMHLFFLCSLNPSHFFRQFVAFWPPEHFTRHLYIKKLTSC